MQMRELPETAELLTFVRTVEGRSITRAARELGVPRPTVGRRLARLEEKLGVRLLRRTTRTMALTDAGEALFARARSLVLAVEEVQQAVRRRDDVPRGVLRVSVPPMQGVALGALAAAYLERCPLVQLVIDSGTRHVDLVAGGFDVAIRATARLAPGLVARTLSRVRLVAVASPSYLAAHKAPRRPTELSAHRCLVGFDRGEHPATHWPTSRGRVRVRAHFASNDLGALREAALRGQGIAMLPSATVWDDLANGTLVAVLPDRLVGEAHVALVWADREFVPAAVRAFVEEAVRWAATQFVLTPQPDRDAPLPSPTVAAKAEPRPRRTRAKSPSTAR